MAVSYDQTFTWREEELTQRERTWGVHGIHPYLGKTPPQLPAKLIEQYSQPGDLVLDPFAGSFTTGVEALRLGREFCGVDLAEFNCLLGRVKLGQHNTDVLEGEINHFLDALYQRDYEYDGDVPEYISLWYGKSAIETLCHARDILDTFGYESEDVLRLIVSRSARSARRAPHYELDFPKAPVHGPYWCYKHQKECVPTAGALGFVTRYAKDTLKRIKQYAEVRGDLPATVVCGDTRQPGTLFDLDSKAKLVVTSPPYLGLIDYHRQHEYAYALFPDLERRDEREIGSATKGRSYNAKVAYIMDMVMSLKSAKEATTDDAAFVIIANDSHDLYGTIFGEAGLEEVQRMHRTVDRRTGLRSTSYSETIFVLRKS